MKLVPGRTLSVVLLAVLCTLIQIGWHMPLGPVASIGALLDPAKGLYHNARHAEHPNEHSVEIPGLENTVTVERDERGVPHIFASSERDAVMTLGYVVAQDRLTQMDFLPRVASGRLAEVFGVDALEADRFLRSTGMEWGARKHVQMLEAEAGATLALTQWFAVGANAYIDGLSNADLPFEFKLFAYRPDRYSTMHAALLLQYFAYDLTFTAGEPAYSRLRDNLDSTDFELLYPSTTRNNVVIASTATERRDVGQVMSQVSEMAKEAAKWGALGFRPSKGSNNWVVGPARSTTGAPILAGDIHLALTLPAIWYEAHVVTPHRNAYGVVSPGTPVLVEAFNDAMAWAFTNTGADVLDHYLLELDASGHNYLHNGEWRGLEAVPDTMVVKNSSIEVDTLWYSHYGPVVRAGDRAIALKWVAHDPGRTLHALAGMNQAANMEDFESALEDFSVPAQNIIAADTSGNISIRSTGRIPVRSSGRGLLDGTSDVAKWSGWIPFDSLPHLRNPPHGYLFSANQEPTNADYPFYLGHDWPDPYRALRIDELLGGQDHHSVSDFMAYQADVHVVQHEFFARHFQDLDSLSREAEEVRNRLSDWDGEADLEDRTVFLFAQFLDTLRALAWDEPAFIDLPKPKDFTLLKLLEEGSDWLDVVATPVVEDARELVALALERTAAGTSIGENNRQWGEYSGVVFNHIMGIDAIRGLSRGAYPFPGFDETVSPGGGRPTTHGASWRMIVDFSHQPPKGIGVYPGGQSGRPLSRFYDMNIAPYIDFEYYDLHKPREPGQLSEVSSVVKLSPGSPGDTG